MRLMALVILILAVGCRTPYREAANQAIHDPNSDIVRLEAQIAAIKAGQSNIPEHISQLQDDGWAYWMRGKDIVRNPDDTPLLIKTPSGLALPVFAEYESLGKWNLVNTLNGGAIPGGLEELEFYSGRWRPGETGKHYSSGRDGFQFSLKAITGNVGVDASTIEAKYGGQAAVKAALGTMLGTTLEQHWAGKAGLLKVAMDGTVSILKEGREIAGVLVKTTPLGLAATGLEQLAVTLRTPTGEKTEVLTQP
jgi:hypothetical protein